MEDFRLNSENNVEPKAQLGEKNEPQTKQNCQKENSEETLNEGAIIVAENKSAGTLSEDSNETGNNLFYNLK